MTFFSSSPVLTILSMLYWEIRLWSGMGLLGLKWLYDLKILDEIWVYQCFNLDVPYGVGINVFILSRQENFSVTQLMS